MYLPTESSAIDLSCYHFLRAVPYQWGTAIGLLHVTFNFCFKVSLCAKLFLWKWVGFVLEGPEGGNCFLMTGFANQTCFGTEAKGRPEMAYFVKCLDQQKYYKALTSQEKDLIF